MKGNPARRARALPQRKPGALSQTVARALAILRAFDRDKRELGISELSERLDLPKTIVFRLVQTLRDSEFLERNGENAKYRIGLGAFEIGNLFKSPTLDAEAAPFMRQLVDQTGHTAQLAVLHRDEMVIIGRMEGRGPLKYGVSVGERRRLHNSAVGKAVLSALTAAQVDAMLAPTGLKKVTTNTITDPRALRTELQQIRARGYAVNWEENTPGVASVAAPVVSRHSPELAALSVAFPANPAARKEVPRIGKLVSAAALALAERI
jgi:DNA-binding IclR family transcriptional regulator